MPNKTYSESIDWLFKQFPAYHKIGVAAYKPDLTNCLRLSELFNHPEEKLQFIHVAGTNGKGSTSSMLASVLQESGKKVGLFTSPHIEDFRERIRVNGVMISEQEVVDFCSKIQTLQLDFEPSFFEITWVMALVHFQYSDCDICVIETGLGGRLDATNIITPVLSIITNIGLEHVAILGDTLAKIAAEKAGIIKSNIPVIIGETLPETLPVFEEVARACNSKIYFAERETNDIPANFPLLGEYQKKNVKIIQTAIPILNSKGFQIGENQLHLGLINLSKNSGFRGRMQIIDNTPLTIIDVSHNYDGIKATLETVAKLTKRNLLIVYGTSADKDLDLIFTLFPNEATYFFTEFTNERSASQDDLEQKAKQFNLNSTFFMNPKEALLKAQLIANKEDTILVFGSFFLISDFF